MTWKTVRREDKSISTCMLLKCRSLSSVPTPVDYPQKMFLSLFLIFPFHLKWTTLPSTSCVYSGTMMVLSWEIRHSLSPQGTSANVWRHFSLEHSGNYCHLVDKGQNAIKYAKMSEKALPICNTHLAHNIN